ncbi:uncharacterized protein LOC112595272 [Melanaphis sacchari]|uniref:uncharacterized protein LOC112595272 n=1 Tax=Melanaphis sacchari TaxID=742174 RepID=UPI000DC12D45|nr:uncharacterized protein LOC112595272 [Melanaphis sacchari]
MSITLYNFEPLITDVNNYDYLEYKESVVSYNDRSKLAVTDWCSCGKCEKQINDRECTIHDFKKQRIKQKKRSLQSATVENKAWRYICYKQFTLWVNSWMTIGRGNRVVIPSCVVKNRERYPEEKGLYIGFKNQLFVV